MEILTFCTSMHGSAIQRHPAWKFTTLLQSDAARP
jgi:hypothetical protein